MRARVWYLFKLGLVNTLPNNICRVRNGNKNESQVGSGIKKFYPSSASAAGCGVFCTAGLDVFQEWRKTIRFDGWRCWICNGSRNFKEKQEKKRQTFATFSAPWSPCCAGAGWTGAMHIDLRILDLSCSLTFVNPFLFAHEYANAVSINVNARETPDIIFTDARFGLKELTYIWGEQTFVLNWCGRCFICLNVYIAYRGSDFLLCLFALSPRAI
jgi:hypothetical protein